MRILALLLPIAAVIGVVVATGLSCVIGLSLGTDNWCELLIPFVGFWIAIPVALLAGLPLFILFQRRQISSWWQYGFGGFMLALPIWWLFATPFESARWQHAGFFDSLVYLGSGAFGGLAFYLLLRLELWSKLHDSASDTRTRRDMLGLPYAHRLPGTLEGLSFSRLNMLIILAMLWMLFAQLLLVPVVVLVRVLSMGSTDFFAAEIPVFAFSCWLASLHVRTYRSVAPDGHTGLLRWIAILGHACGLAGCAVLAYFLYQFAVGPYRTSASGMNEKLLFVLSLALLFTGFVIVRNLSIDTVPASSAADSDAKLPPK